MITNWRQRELLIIILLFYNCALAQVNTEAMRGNTQKKGITNKGSFGLATAAGNSDYLEFKIGHRLDVLTDKLHSFLVLKINQREANKKLYAKKGFLHLRLVQNLGEHLFLEGFAQMEYNDFINLRSRTLFGSGVRFQVIKSETKGNLYFGTGAMYEHEKYTNLHEQEKKLIRSTNYLSSAWLLDERIKLTAASYYQAAVSRLFDFRLLLDSELEFKINKTISIGIQLTNRYDNEPIAGIKKYDLEITNTINISF